MRSFELSPYEKIIAGINLDIDSRDDIPKILLGLKHLYLYYKHIIIDLLYSDLAKRVDMNTGRLGMELWKAFVLCSLRVNLNWDFDRLHNMMNKHADIRALLGHESSDKYQYKLQTVKDNFQLFSCEVINEISTLVVNVGHDLIKNGDDSELKINTRCDSFPVQSNVHFPTDINLLFDAGRKMLSVAHKLASRESIQGWRQNSKNQKTYKQYYDATRTAKRAQKKSGMKSQLEVEKSHLPYSKEVRDAHESFIGHVSYLVEKSGDLVLGLRSLGYTPETSKEYRDLDNNLDLMVLFMGQIERRVLYGEVIPNSEKLYSIFEPYTEWLDKGKQPKSIDLGLNVCIMEDQYGFILHHHVMENEVDKEIAVSMVVSTKENHNSMISCSFDRGFYTEKNKLTISGLLDRLCMPKKGKKSKAEIEEEQEYAFVTDRKKHSAVESAVNALQVHGLKRCLDRGINHFKRYISASIMARNLQQLGSILLKQALLQEEVFSKAA